MMKRLLATLFLCLLPVAPAFGAAGTCTQTVDGTIQTATFTGANCSDLNDQCGGGATTCPDSDDKIVVNGHTLVFDVTSTHNLLDNSVAGGDIIFNPGTVTTTANSGGANNNADLCSSATGSYTILPGATHLMRGGTLPCQQNGHVRIVGDLIYAGTISSTGLLTATTLKINFLEPPGDAQVGDYIRIKSGLAKGYFFEISAVDRVADPFSVTIDTSLTDAAHNYTAGTMTQVIDSRHFAMDPGGPDHTDTDDGALLGEYFWDGASSMFPIVSVDAVASEEDIYALWYDVGAAALSGGAVASYGFEVGGDDAEIFRPATFGLAASETGRTWQFNNASRTTIQYAIIEGFGPLPQNIDNANRPTEYFDLSDTLLRDAPNAVRSFSFGTLAADAAHNVSVERIAIINPGNSPAFNFIGTNNTLKDSLIADKSGSSGNGITVAQDTVGGLIEGTSIQRVPQAISLASTTQRPEITIRGCTLVGKGTQSGSGDAVSFAAGLAPDSVWNDGKQRIFNTIGYSYGNAIYGTSSGLAIQQKFPSVNTIGAYSLGGNADGWYRGDAYNSVAFHNARHGISEGRDIIGSLSQENTEYGIGGVAEFCVANNCSPNIAVTRARGNLSTNNGKTNATWQGYHYGMEISHNTFSVGGTDNNVLFQPADDPPTADNSFCTAASTPRACCTGLGTGTCVTQACANTNCSQASGQRPAWWVGAPVPVESVTFRDNIVGDQAGSSGIKIGAITQFTASDVTPSYNYFWDLGGGASPDDVDMGLVTPAATDDVDQLDPFTDSAAGDFTLVDPSLAVLAGSDGRTRGAGMAGIVSDPDLMPPIYSNLYAVIPNNLVLRNGELESVDTDSDGTAEFLNFTMTGQRVTFTFTTTPTCADVRNCADLHYTLFPSDGSAPVESVTRVPVIGTAKKYSVAETAFVLAQASIGKLGSACVHLEIGATVSPESCLDFTAEPFSIPNYSVPASGGSGGGSVILGGHGSDIQ